LRIDCRPSAPRTAAAINPAAVVGDRLLKISTNRAASLSRRRLPDIVNSVADNTRARTRTHV